MPDAYITANHLGDRLNEASIEQLLSQSLEPGLLPRVPAGLDRGKSWDRIDSQALHELSEDRDADVRFSAQTELRRRLTRRRIVV